MTASFATNARPNLALEPTPRGDGTLTPHGAAQHQRELAGLANTASPALDLVVSFEILDEIEDVETIASGTAVPVRAWLTRVHSRGRWRKRKGFANVRLANGAVPRNTCLTASR